MHNTNGLPESEDDFWKRKSLQEDTPVEHLTYWKQQLNEASAILQLPTDRPRPAVQTFEGAQQFLVLPKTLTQTLQTLSQQEGVTPFISLLAAFYILLQRYTGQEDLVVGSTITNRTQKEVDGLIECFVNMVALRSNLSGNPNFRELLVRVREGCLEAYAHRDLPFEQLVEDLQRQGSLNHLPVFDAVINFSDAPPPIWELPGLTMTSVPLVEPVARFPITVDVEARENGLSLRLVYQRALFSPERIARILDQFQYLLEQIVVAPEKSIQSYSLVTPEAMHLLPNPRTVLAETQYELITDVFASWVSRAPEQPAVCQGQRSWTYQQLAESANALAQLLVTQGQKQGDVVAIIGQRSFGLIAGMMAALLSGAVLLPIDRSLPTHRQQLMLREAGAKHLLYIGKWRPEDKWIQELVCPAIIRVESDKGEVVEPQSALDVKAAQLPALSPNDAAYIFFTSGTTGIPKGVLGCHKGLSHFLNWQRETFAVGPDDRCAQLAGLSFDVVLRDVFLPLTSGATLCLPPWSDEPGLDQVLLWLEHEKISLLHTVPTLAQSWLANIPSGVSLRSLRWVFFAGEPLTDMLVHWWRAAFPGAGRIANFYGPTETSLAKCCYIVDSDTVSKIQPIGFPLPETQVLVLTESYQLCGIGEIGEIVLRTPFRTLGYINAPEENRKRFVKNPFRNDEGDLLYHTGDRGRYRLDGSLEILGRLDHQVKIRGVRVEPDEVMATLLLHPAVKSCVVVVQNNEQDQNSLVAYVVIASQERVTSSELRSYLSSQLPAPMVPSVFVLLEALPLTPNGKVDRQALPTPNFSRGAQDFVAASTPLQEMVAASWSQALGIGQIGIHDNFFSLGGHSLLAMQVITHLRITLQVELSLRSFFEAPTIAQLAERISQLQADETTSSLLPSIQAVSRESYRQPISGLVVGVDGEGADEVVVIPTSLQQQGLWLVHHLESNSPAYNVPVVLRLHEHLDMVALEQSVHAVVEHHESLRTTFVLIGDQPMQVIVSAMAVPLRALDLRALSAEHQEAEVQRLLAQQMQQPFDLACGPLLCVTVLQLGDREHLVLLLMHHIISDGWSVGVISQELTQLYDIYVTGRQVQLAALPLQYADFALWQREWLQAERLEKQLAYWKEALAGAPPVLTLPHDHPRPTMPTHRGATYTFALPKPLSGGLKHLSQQEGVTLYMTLVAGFVCLLQRYTGQDDVVIGTTAAGRIQQETKDLVGYFVNTLVLRTNLGGNPNVQQVLARVREVVLTAHEHQQVPFERLVKELQPERSLNQHPIFQVLLTLDPPLPTLASNWEYAQVRIPTTASKFDLSLVLCEQEGALEGYLEYSVELFEEATIVRLLTHWRQLLEAMVADPQQSVAQLSLLTEREREQLLWEWNATEQSYPQKGSSQLFEEQVERTPDAVALVFEQQQITYRELNQRANQLAHYLQGLGIRPEMMVGLCVQRSVEMMVGLLGILKAGGVYVPLDPEAAAQRLAFQMQQTQMPVLLTQARLLSRLPHLPIQLHCLDRDCESIEQRSSANPISTVTGEQLAYVIYTSGSTGQPKGVLIEHGALAAHCWSMAQVYELRAADHVLQFSTTTFDASLEQILPTLFVGGQLVLRGPDLWSPSQLLQHIEQQHVSVINLPTAYWNQVTQACRQIAEEGRPSPLRLVIVGGDRLLPEALHVWRQITFGSVRLLNAYGPTEATITATLYDTAGYTDSNAGLQSVPIGRPVPNRTIYLLDGAGNQVPVGLVGELHIGGELLARGYLKCADLTAERFFVDPFSGQPGARLYKTGDLARYLPDGTLEFVGRADQQVKLRGFRIELGEIEAVLHQHPAVREAVVVARQDRPGEKV
ncbi:MAG: amino acid adenylation domain-containing protein, partial [Chloroflexi bacterium]|nr:amino acid adenylation domain-containing protein [Chloroflexota bacterium]